MAQKRISKISYKGGDNGAAISFEEIINDKNTKDTIFKSVEEPHADFKNALQNLCTAVYEILLFPKEYAEEAMRITSVSYSYNEDADVKGAVITGLITLETSAAPFCFNTPHLAYSAYSESNTSPTMPEMAINLLEKLEEEALEYVNGKRSQMAFDFAGQVAA